MLFTEATSEREALPELEDCENRRISREVGERSSKESVEETR